MSESWQRGDYEISTDRARLNTELIHDYLSNHSYWATGRSLEVVKRSIENSLAFGIYKGNDQLGFARVVTDYATFAWIADAFVLPSTKDAHGLYEQFGFMKLHRPERWMERPDPNMKESPDYWQAKSET